MDDGSGLTEAQVKDAVRFFRFKSEENISFKQYILYFSLEKQNFACKNDMKEQTWRDFSLMVTNLMIENKVFAAIN